MNQELHGRALEAYFAWVPASLPTVAIGNGEGRGRESREERENKKEKIKVRMSLIEMG